MCGVWSCGVTGCCVWVCGLHGLGVWACVWVELRCTGPCSMKICCLAVFFVGLLYVVVCCVGALQHMQQRLAGAKKKKENVNYCEASFLTFVCNYERVI